MPRLRFFARFSAISLCFAAVVPDAGAQSSQARGSTKAHHTDVPSSTAHVRLWRTDLHNYPLLRVVLTIPGNTPKQRATTREIDSGGPGYRFNNYSETPSGHGTLVVFDNPAPAGVASAQPHGLVSSPVDFAPGSFVTVLLDEPRKAGAPPQLNVIVDRANSDEPDVSSAQINVRNFVAGLQDVHVTFGDSLNAQFAGGNNYLQMQGLKPVVYPVRTMGTGVDGKPFEWITEADLRQHHHQTLLIYPDPYGRVRPRMSVDGEVPVEPPPSKEDQR